MKKSILKLGTLVSIVAPITALISCSGNDKAMPNVENKKSETIKPTEKTKLPKNENIKPIKNKKLETIKQVQKVKQVKQVEPPKMENPIFKVAQDGFYILAKDYNGELRENNLATGPSSSKLIVPIKKNNSYKWIYTTMLGNNDSFYMIYDSDDSDGISMSNFTDTVFFEDTSVLMDKAVYKANAKIGNIDDTSTWQEKVMAKFIPNKNNTGGNLNQIIGGQNNHYGDKEKSAAFQNSLQKICEAYKSTPSVLNAVLNYYGMKISPNGNQKFIKNLNLVGGSSSIFTPVFQNSPIFSYKKVSSNAIKITYHFEPTYMGTAAKMVIKHGKKFDEYGSFSLGNEKEWSSYRKHADAKYAGYKTKK